MLSIVNSKESSSNISESHNEIKPNIFSRGISS